MTYVLEREQVVASPRAAVFAFFADAANLERMSPPSLRFRILTALPIAMRAGTVIDYKLSLLGLGFKWRTVIDTFEPEARFVDVQRAGPYRSWRHTHEFADVPNGTRVRDHVEYEMPFGILGRAVRSIFVERQLQRIFDFRAEAMARQFGVLTAEAPSSSRGP
jgi:ligand-binding SRPBCC domain-containing protein